MQYVKYTLEMLQQEYPNSNLFIYLLFIYLSICL